MVAKRARGGQESSARAAMLRMRRRTRAGWAQNQ
jgi:hypothetical protein